MLRERFSETLKTAMKAGDKRRVATVRLIQAALFLERALAGTP